MDECVGWYWETRFGFTVMPHRGMTRVMHNCPALLHECTTSHSRAYTRHLVQGSNSVAMDMYYHLISWHVKRT